MSADIEHLRAVGRAATEEPWVEITFYPDRSEVHSRPIAERDEEDPLVARMLEKCDAEFIATARNEWDALLDELEALRAKVARVEALADGWNSTPDYNRSEYDQGRVDQRHDMCGGLLEALEGAALADANDEAGADRG